MNEYEFHTALKRLVTEAVENDLTIEGGFPVRTLDPDTSNYDVEFTLLSD